MNALLYIMEPNKNKIIIFDMDGVIVDSTGAAMHAMMESYPGLTPQMHRELAASGNFREELKKYSTLKKPETEEETVIRKKQYSEIKSKMPLFDGIKKMLEKLHQDRFIIVINTSAYDRNCLPILENTQINHLIDFAATADFSISKVDKFKLIEEKFGADNKDTLFVTDTLGDVREADIAGVPTIAVTWGAHDKTFFEREKHSNLIKIADTVGELENFIEQYWK